MSTINFGGLASGMDTESIITALMEIESQPLESLEADANYYESETSAYAEFDSKMADLLSAVEELDTLDEVSSFAASSSDETLLTASAGNNSIQGNYEIEVLSLAESQKDVSAEGFADSSTVTLSGSLTIGDTTFDYEDITLGDLKDMINEDDDLEITASIIYDGTDEGYRLMLSADEAGVETDIVGTGSIVMDTTTDGHTKNSAEAHIVVDGIDIYSTDNSITNAIPGVTLNLSDTTDEGDTMTVSVDTDTSALESKLDDFVSAYNSIISWIDDQSDASWGTDSSITSVQRKMQSLLSTQISGNDTYSALVNIGFETDWETGYLSYSSSDLSDAIADDADAVFNLLAGDDETDGILDSFATYFDYTTDSSEGIYAIRKDSNDASIDRIEDDIYSMELRLEQREETLRAQYTAMEELISTLNNQMSYLSALSS